MVDFIGIGAQKSGTSWAYACLYEHPEICSPVKEIHFFSRPRFEKGQSWYEHHFVRCSAGQKQGEFSTSYLYSKEAPQRIKSFYPTVKLIAILRNPKTRAYSQYRNAVKAGEIAANTTFTDYVNQEPSVFQQGLYAEQLARYYEHFSKEQILVLIYEDIAKDPAIFMQKIYDFLGVGTSFTPNMLHREVNVARTPKFVAIDRMMHKVAETLRQIGLDKFVWLIRKSGLPDLLRSANTKTGELTDTRDTVYPAEMQKAWRQDAEKLSSMIGRDMVKEWNL